MMNHLTNVSVVVKGTYINVVSQLLPSALNADDLGLTTENTFCADFLGHTRNLRGEYRELVHHGVDGELQVKNLALDVDGDFTSQISPCYGFRNIRNLSNLIREVCGHVLHIGA
jgi:hypothetical protein